MSLEYDGIERMKLQLRRLAFIPELANQELKDLAEMTAEMARDMAPIDYGDLKEAIQVRRTGAQGTGGRFLRGVSNFEVYINQMHPVSDPEKIKHGVTRVGEYAWLVHQYMGYGGTPGYIDGHPFNPSAESVAAGRSKGVDAGGRFLERAGYEMTSLVNSRMALLVTKAIEALDK